MLSLECGETLGIQVLRFDLSSLVSAELPLPTNVLRDYTLEFKIRVERAFMYLRECLRGAVRDKDYYRQLTDTLIEDIKGMSSAHESELATLRQSLIGRGQCFLA